LTAAALSASFALGAALPASAVEKKPEFTFGALRTAPVEVAKAKAADWLKSTGKMDQKAFEAIWANEDMTVLDKVAETFKIGSADAAKLLAESANAENAPPKAVPALLEDAKQDVFFRANLALAYGRDLINFRVYEEGWKAIKGIQPELVVDPSTYFFHRAVAEHALAMSLPGFSKEQAAKTIIRLLDDVADAPDRYKMVATIMFFDMQTWKKDEKDLSNIVKLMDNSERRLDLGRGGKITQDIQKKIVFRLDELIKEKEQQAKSGQCNGGNCPGGGKGQGGGPPTSPMQDSNPGGTSGPGNVLETKIKHYQENWGKMPEAERARAIQELTRDLPPRYRLVIEDYFKTLNKSTPTP
jgi:hypothetical protein